MDSKILENYRDKETGLINFDLFEKEHGEDIKTWEEDRGTARRGKKWLLFDNNKILVRNENLDEEDVKFTTYQELLFEELAKQVDFPCAHYDIGRRGDKNCTFSYNVLDEEENRVLNMLSLNDLMGQLENAKDYSHSYSMEDALNAISNYCKSEKISPEQYEKVLQDFCKMQVLDIFLASTDRHCENISFIYGLDEKTGEKIFKLSPLYDNELSCYSELKEEDMQNCVISSAFRKTIVPLYFTCATAPEDEEYRIVKGNNPSSSLLEYIMDLEDDDVNDFVYNCLNSLDIEKAITSVEERMGVELPDLYQNLLSVNYNERRKMLSKTINEFYPEIG